MTKIHNLETRFYGNVACARAVITAAQMCERLVGEVTPVSKCVAVPHYLLFAQFYCSECVFFVHEFIMATLIIYYLLRASNRQGCGDSC